MTEAYSPARRVGGGPLGIKLNAASESAVAPARIAARCNSSEWMASMAV